MKGEEFVIWFEPLKWINPFRLVFLAAVKNEFSGIEDCDPAMCDLVELEHAYLPVWVYLGIAWVQIIALKLGGWFVLWKMFRK